MTLYVIMGCIMAIYSIWIDEGLNAGTTKEIVIGLLMGVLWPFYLYDLIKRRFRR